MEWSPDGQYLAIILSKSSQILLWDSLKRKISPEPVIETKLKNVDYLLWCSETDLVFCIVL